MYIRIYICIYLCIYIYIYVSRRLRLPLAARRSPAARVLSANNNNNKIWIRIY